MGGATKILDEAIGSSLERKPVVVLEHFVVAVPDKQGLELAWSWVVRDNGRLGKMRYLVNKNKNKRNCRSLTVFNNDVA